MIAYLATKGQFIKDAPIIEDVIREAVEENLNLRVGRSEFESWRNSLGNAMSHVMNSNQIPDNSAIAIEYRINGRSFRLDFLVVGKNEKQETSMVIVELKQWTEVENATKVDHVLTAFKGGLVETIHPSYQAWSYKSQLESYNEYIYSNKTKISACAYLHNMKNNQVINSSRYEHWLREAPVFLHGEYEMLQKYISTKIKSGVDLEVVREIDKAKILPSKELADTVKNMLKGHEEYVLLDEQKTAFEEIVYRTRLASREKKQVIIIKGGPGTGKSVIAINALSRLVGEQLNCKYITANAAPREVFQAKLIDSMKKAYIANLFSGSGSFHATDKDSFDCLIVDEAHRLRLKSGMFSNLGEDQVAEIISASRCSVFFIDEAQKVTWKDVGEVSGIKAVAARQGAEVTLLELVSQFRCSGSDDYLAWLDDFLGIRSNPNHYFTGEGYELKFVNSVSELREIIRVKNKEKNRARMVAGYCWDWVSKKDSKKFDIEFPKEGFKAKWNLAEYGNEWIINPKSVEEIGCIHTCQGLEVDYVGVIIGPDMEFRDGKFITHPDARARTDKSLAGFQKEFKENPVEARAKADLLIRNTYRTLMTRGLKGCYVYICDKDEQPTF